MGGIVKLLLMAALVALPMGKWARSPQSAIRSLVVVACGYYVVMMAAF